MSIQQYACRNIVNTIKTSRHSSLEKYTSHFIRKGYERVTKGYVWEVSWRLNKDCNILTPTLLAIPAFLSRSAGLLKRGPCLCWVWFSLLELKHWLQTLISNWSKLPVTLGYITIRRPPASCERHICTQFNPSTVKVIPWYLWLDAPVIYTGAFLIWQLGRAGGQYVTLIVIICLLTVKRFQLLLTLTVLFAHGYMVSSIAI